MMFVDVFDICRAELVAQIVDFTLVVVGGDDVLLLGVLYITEKQYLIGHRSLYSYEHGVDVMVYLFGELSVALTFAYEYLSYSVAAVGYALYLAHYAEHRCYAVLSFIGEASFGAAVEIVGYLDLHAVGYLLIFLKAGELLGEFFAVVFTVYDVLSHPYHALYALGVHDNLFFSLGDVELGGADHADLNELELEFLFLVGAGWHEMFHDFHVQTCKPYHNGQVDEIEHGVEHRKSYRNALLHHSYLCRHRMPGRQSVVKQMVVCVRVGGFDIVDECREGSRVALSELFREPLCEVAEREEYGEGPGCAEEVE